MIYPLLTLCDVTVVSLRQLERQRERERERTSEQLRVVEDTYKQHVSRLEAKLREMERERNLLMVRTCSYNLIGCQVIKCYT